MKKGVKKQMAAVALSLLTVSGIGLTDCSQRLKSWGSQNLMENNIHLDMFRLRTNLRN